MKAAPSLLIQRLMASAAAQETPFVFRDDSIGRTIADGVHREPVRCPTVENALLPLNPLA